MLAPASRDHLPETSRIPPLGERLKRARVYVGNLLEGKLLWQIEARRRTLAADYSLEAVRHSWHAAHCLLVQLTEEELLLLEEALGSDRYYQVVIAAVSHLQMVGTADRMTFVYYVDRFMLPLGFEKEAVLAATLNDVVVARYFLDNCQHLRAKPWFTEVRKELYRQ